MTGQPNKESTVETLGESHVKIDNALPDPTSEEAQRTLALANGGTASPEPVKDEQPKIKDAEVPKFEDPRKKIAEAHRARRLGEMKGGTEDFNDPRLTDPLAGATDEQVAADGPVADQQQAPAERMVKVTVEGREIEVPEKDLISNYQKDRTADYRLQRATEEAKRIVEDAKKLATADGQPPTNADHESGSDRTPPAPTQAKKDTPTDEADVSDEALLDVVEKMQIGSTDEAVKALKKVLTRPAPKQQAADIGTQVEQTIALREENLKSAAALEKFGGKYTAARTNKVVEAAMSQVVRDEMVADLKGAGVPDEFISQFRLTEPEGKSVLMESHRRLRLITPQLVAEGRKGVRTVDQILGTVEKNPDFQRLIGSVQPSTQVTVNREERKAGVQAQPALQSAAPPPSGKQPAPADRSAKQSSAVEQMRKSRGLPAYGAT